MILPRRPCLVALLLALSTGIQAAEAPLSASGKMDFERDIRPIFEAHCFSCHGPEKQKSSFRLDRKTAALQGGDHGVDIIPGKSLESRLIRFVSGLDPDTVMPAKGDRLSAADIGKLRAWIDQGADWPGPEHAAPEEIWWSLRPLVRPPVPQSAGLRSLANPIDAFLTAKLEAAGLHPSPEASRRTLIRRVSFDLTGHHPTLQEVEQFEADADPLAYEHLVDRLLESPEYGERWARHWLDVVHYGDTHGYDKDQPRPNAWPYRDYVIRAFNEDKPYSRFVQEQIAGDVLFPDTRDGIEALGFIAAGPWDLIGHAEVPESKTDGKIARHLDRDDMVATTMNTFNSMTVQCAQCHNHKFDPIPTADYYSLQAVFAAVDRTTREYYDETALNKKHRELVAAERDLAARKKSLEVEIERAGGPEVADLRKKVANVSDKSSSHPAEYGYHSGIASSDTSVKWVQVDLGKPVLLDQVVLAPCWDDFAGIGAGFGFPRRYKIEVSDDAEFKADARVIRDLTGSDQPNPGITLQSFPAGASGRYVRVTATRLAPRQGDYILALAELQAFDKNGKNVALGAEVSALDSTEAPVRWTKKNLVDGVSPGVSVSASTAEIAQWQKQLDQLYEQKLDGETRAAWAEVTNRLAVTGQELANMPKPKSVFVGAVHYGSGAFRGTGADGGKPRPIHILPRGDVRKPGAEVGPGALSAVSALPSRFELPPGSGEGERRKALALWLTDPRNPLTWRSIVNRVWQYHFGRGIVETPNDFGRMGALPSHPELLDWLAVEFRDEGQSIKKLQKLIVTSTDYRQVSFVIDGMQHAVEADSDNHLFWRMNRRKLEAEAVRDSVLLVSGELDRKMFGPGFYDFVIEKPEHSPHYEYGLHDPDDPKSHRRAIYRFIVRSQPEPFMAMLDCADPSMLVEKRNESLSALQALGLLNNGFMLTMARHFAESVQAREPDVAGQVRFAFSTALSRYPSSEEQTALAAFTRRNGLPNTCRLLFNLNEFNFID
jgi:mono/diheme cytochrome c family protein